MGKSSAVTDYLHDYTIISFSMINNEEKIMFYPMETEPMIAGVSGKNLNLISKNGNQITIDLSNFGIEYISFVNGGHCYQGIFW